MCSLRTVSLTDCSRIASATSIVDSSCVMLSPIHTLRQQCCYILFFFFSSRRRHTRFDCDWSSDVCSSDLMMVKLFRQNKIVGGLYSSLGQEAISVGTAYALEKKDWLAPMIRNIGALLGKGVRRRDVFMQHMATYDSPTKGKDGPSHFGDLDDLHIVSPISMLGDLIPVMTGVAMAGRYLGQKIVTMTWIGDGGSSTGVFHEGLNFAATQKAPFVLILENNLWAYSTPVRKQVPLENLADRAKAYGIDSYIVDGNDVVAVYSVAKEAVDRARAGER